MFSAFKALAVAALLARLTSAQTLPTCASNCVTQFTSGSQIAGCNSLDIVCICSNKSFLSDIACCLVGACSAADQNAATQYALNFCKSGGVTGLPTAVSCTSTIASSTTSTPSSSATGAVTSITSSGSSAVTSASSVSSVSSSASSASSSASTHAASVSSQASSSSSSAAASATKNAGPHNVAGMGAGVLGGLAAAVALL